MRRVRRDKSKRVYQLQLIKMRMSTAKTLIRNLGKMEAKEVLRMQVSVRILKTIKREKKVRNKRILLLKNSKNRRLVT